MEVTAGLAESIDPANSNSENIINSLADISLISDVVECRLLLLCHHQQAYEL